MKIQSTWASWGLAVLAWAIMAETTVATEITLEQAETAVGNWIARDGAFGRLSGGGEVSGETFVDLETGAKMHVVRVPGKGFVVTSANDGIEPVVLFSDGGGDGEFIAEAGNPLWDLLRWDLAGRAAALAAEEKAGANVRAAAKGRARPARAKWADLLGETDGKSTTGMGKKSDWGFGSYTIWEKRRDPILATHWNQLEGYNLYTPGKFSVTTQIIQQASGMLSARSAGFGELVATNETGHSPVGCTATAAGQVMKHWAWPKSAKAGTFRCTVEYEGETSGRPMDLTMMGGTYSWGNMGLRAPTTGVQKQNVSHLLYDIGVACGADYWVSPGKGTGIGLVELATAMRETFNYRSAVYHRGSTSGGALKSLLIPNLDAGCPVVMGITGRSSDGRERRHAVDVDGYGYSLLGAFYIHVNLGWGYQPQQRLFWYEPPDIAGDYTSIESFVCNIFPKKSGAILSGRVTGGNGRPVSGVTVDCGSGGSTKTGKDGIYAFILGAGSYTVKAGDASSTGYAERGATVEATTASVNGNRVVDLQLPDAPTVLGIGWNLFGHPEVASVRVARANESDDVITGPIEVELECATPEAEIRYTLDGAQPGPESTLYEGKIMIQDTTTLRAVAYADGMECSEEFQRTWTFNDPQSRDNFANARPISGASGKSSFNNEGYTKETGEPTHSSKGTAGGASAWAKWTAPATGDWTFRLSGVCRDYPDEDMDTQLAVYTGNSVSNLTRVAANDDANRNEEDYSSRVSFSAEAGTTYHIAMDSYQGATYPGALTLEWEEGWVDWAQFEYTPQWVPVSGGEWGMEVSASANWTVTDHSDWIEPVVYSGEAGGRISYRVATNSAGNDRTGYVTLQAGNSEFTSLEVRQHKLDFVTTKEAALDRAWRENKRILVIYGREGCYYTSTTMFYTLPTARVRALLDEGFVLWYSNCDRQSDAYPFISRFSGSTLPTLAIVDPLDLSGGVAGLGGYQSASAIQSLLQSAPAWGGLPPALVNVSAASAASATVTTKVRAWGNGASSAVVTLETADDAAFTNVKRTRKLGTITKIWTEQAWTFAPPSATEAVFCRLKVSSGDWSVVSDVVEFIPLGIALDNDTLSFTSGGEVPWLGQTSASHDGMDAARCESTEATGTNRWVESHLKTRVQGPGWLSFWWKGDGAYGWLRLYVDGREQESISVTNKVWKEVRWHYPNASEHEVAWVLQRYNYSSASYNATGWVDQVTWTQEELVPLATALDNDTLAFTSAGSVPWLGQTEVSHDGVDAARCANPTADGGGWATASLKTTVRGPGRLSFWWRKDGNSASFYLYENGSYRSEGLRNTNQTWAAGSLSFANTNATEVEWRFGRYDYASSYYNATGWVDQVTWTPGNIVTLDRQNGYSYKPTVLAIRGEAMPTVDVPTKTGYTFGGYYSGTNGTGTRYYTASGTSARTWNRTENATLYATWTPEPYMVTLNREGGTGGTASVTALYGRALPAIEVPVRAGCVFGGYFSGKDGTGTQYYTASGVSVRTWNQTGTATLFAKWTTRSSLARGSYLDPNSAFWDVEFGEPSWVFGHGAYAAAGGGTTIGCTTNSSGARTWWVPGSEDPGILQRAVDQARAGDTIQVAPGCYDPIVVRKDRISIVSRKGRMKTFINGKYDARCVDFGSTQNGKITGFTLVQGSAWEGDGGGIRGGSASYCLIEGCQAAHGGGAALSALSDCFVTWNTADASGGGAYGGSLLRCEVRHNEAAIGGGAVATTATGTLFAGNEATTKAGGAEQSTLMACTVADNRAKSAAGVSGCTVKNSLLHGNRLTSGATNNHASSTCQYTCAWPVPAGTGNFNALPNFVNQAAENYHLNNYSKCRDKANKNLSKTPWDLAGLDRAMGSNADAGACEYATGVTPLDPADYDGDGLPDVGFFNPSNGTWFVKRTSDGTVWRLALGNSGSKIVPRDWDGDGVRDPAVYDSNTGTWTIRQSGTGSVATKKLGWKGITAVDAADWDGDGKVDPIIFNPASKTWQILQSGNGATAVVKDFGTDGAKLFCGDYDGDGHADLAYYVARNFRWYVRFRDGRTTWVTLGASGVRPCPVDLDMDGALDAGYFDPATGKWTVRSFATRATTTVKFGDKTTTPHPYDWNNDGMPDTLGIYSPYRAGFLDLYKNADGSTAAYTINF